MKSWAGDSGSTVVPSVTANSDTSGPSRYSSTTTRAQVAACASAASRSVVTTTPLPAASPSSFTTYGDPSASSAAATSSGVEQTTDAPVATPAAAMTSLANALDPSRAAAAFDGPKQAMPWARTSVGGAGHQRTLGADHDQVDREVAGQLGDRHRIGHVQRHRVDLGRDARVARSREHLGDRRVGQQRVHQGVLPGAPAHDEDPHDFQNSHQRRRSAGTPARGVRPARAARAGHGPGR